MKGPLAAPAPLVDVRREVPGIVVRLSYAQARSAFGGRFYRSNVALLRLPVARRLAGAQRRLRRAGFSLVVWDAYRPRSVHDALWRRAPAARSRYLANPRRGSKHSRGAAVDVSLVTAAGAQVEMPTPHDEFSPRAHRGAVKGVSHAGRRNRALLDAAMRGAGFLPNRYEWWHYDAPDWRRYPPSDAPLPLPEPPPGP